MTTESALNEYLKIAAGINKTLAEYSDKTHTRKHNTSMRKMLGFYEKLHTEPAVERECILRCSKRMSRITNW